jgi:hypothetical protein
MKNWPLKRQLWKVTAVNLRKIAAREKELVDRRYAAPAKSGG